MNSLFGVEVEKEVESKKAEWLRRFRRDFVKKPGEHLLIVGITGSGKTQCMFWLVHELMESKSKETIVWFDIGKSAEFLTLAHDPVLSKFKPVKLLIPNGYDVEIRVDYENVEKEFVEIDEIWDKIDGDYYNIVILEPFITDPIKYVEIFSKVFQDLINKAHNYEIKTPLTVFYDEFHNVCPTIESALNKRHFNLGAIIQKNVERLRSLKIRFIASTHGMTKIRKGVRTSFNWLIIKRISDTLGIENKRLNEFIPFFNRLQNKECVIVYPERIFSDVIELPYYEYPHVIVRYIQQHGISMVGEDTMFVSYKQYGQAVENGVSMVACCPSCGSTQIIRYGHKPDGRQRYLCKICGHQFTKPEIKRFVLAKDLGL